MRVKGEKRLPSGDRHEEAARELPGYFFPTESRTFPEKLVSTEMRQKYFGWGRGSSSWQNCLWNWSLGITARTKLRKH